MSDAQRLDQAESSLLTLSSAARKRLDLMKLTDALGSAVPTMRGAATEPEIPLSDADRARLRSAINITKEEFLVTLTAMKRVTWTVLALIMVAIAAAIAGGALLQISSYAGIISIASVGALIPLLQKAWRLARDQSLLELIPARYALAAEFCRTTSDAQALISQFLKETAVPQ